MKEVMIVAAEASSSHYALKLIEELNLRHNDLHFFGVGSQDMENAGFERLGKSEEMAVVGATEIFRQFSFLKSVFDLLLQQVRIRKPKFVIVMDYPEFNLFLSRKIFPTGIPVLYYISPQVWAWRKGRVHTIKKFCKNVFLLFPFEIPFYSQFQVPYEFVGHPLLDELDENFFKPEYLKLIRNKRGIADKEIVLGIMPGSRRLEIEKHFPIQLEVANRLYKRIPNLKVMIMVAPTITKESLHPYLESLQIPYMMIKDDPFRMISLTDFVLATSGTATLMVGLLEKPMVIMYKMSWSTYAFAKIFIRGIKYFGLVNLILGEEVVPERWQGRANEDELEKLLYEIATQPQKAKAVKDRLAELKTKLGEKGATKRVAQYLEKYL